jgi:hypothetical protein
MTTYETIIVVAAVAVIAGSAVFLLMARRLRGKLAAAKKGELTPEQLRGVTELTERLERLVKDMDARIAEHLTRIDAAMAQAEAKTAQLRQAATSDPPPAEPPQSERFLQAQDEQAGQPIWQPPQDSLLEDELVTLPGTWPVPPSRPGAAASQASPPNGSKLQSPRHAEVLRLHGQSLAAPDIARKLRMDVGEVELVLRLHGAEAGPC